MRLAPDVQVAARALIAERLGLDFPENRKDELEQRLVRACRASRAADVGPYISRLERLPDDSPEWRRLVSELTIGETYFLRDRGCFEALEADVLPSLIDQRRREGSLRLRIWSAGCATGEEPYSLALLVDRLLPDRSQWAVTILGTDLNPAALAAARRAVYRKWALRETPEAVRRRYFLPHGTGRFELVPAIRNMVTFAPLNLAEDAYPSHATNTSAMDVILCRNVVMYFTREAQEATVARLRRALVPGGWLVVSPAEASAQLLGPLKPVTFPGAIFFRKEPEQTVAAAARPQREPARRVPPAPQRRSERRPSAPRAAPKRERPSLDGAPRLEVASAEAGRGNLDRARELCLEAVAGDRLNADAYVLLAEIEQERGEIAAAVEAIRRAIYLAPDSPSAHFVLGSLLLRQGQRGKARQSMEAVVSLVEHLPPEQAVPGADGLTAGRLLETAAAYLESW